MITETVEVMKAMYFITMQSFNEHSVCELHWIRMFYKSDLKKKRNRWDYFYLSGTPLPSNLVMITETVEVLKECILPSCKVLKISQMQPHKISQL